MRDTLDYGAIGSNLGRQLMQGAGAYENAQTKMGQILAQQGAQQAHANLYNEQANQLRQRGQYQTPEYASKVGAGIAGLTDPQAAAVVANQSGLGWAEELPRDFVGPPQTTEKAPTWATPETMGKYNAGRAAHLMSLGGTGNTNAEQMADAVAKLLGQGRIDSAIADPSKAAAFGQAMAASKGQPLFHQGANGTMQLFTGQENLNEVGRSAALENRAQAGNAAASAALSRSKIGQQTINPDGSVSAPVGKAPAGYRYKPDGSLEPIPGGPADQKVQGQFNADTASRDAAVSAMERLADEAESIRSHKGLGGITGIKGVFPNIPGGDAANANARLDTLKSQIAFSTLQAMRDASKTGGALGAVSEKELILLQNNLAALDRAQSHDEFKKALANIVQFTKDSRVRITNAYNLKHQKQPSGSDGVDINALLKKYGD